ncbi:glucuronate isomerase [Propionibacteriaceae bacterium Y1685]|uniref:glucuronate isomerase n=1 Tax=Microlunatus sp. Y1700 TaxID=3418487 RepID=UPI003B79FC80
MSTVHPDRLLPADPATRDVARRLYQEVADAPILSPHGHVSPSLLLDDASFGSPSELLITPDHYVTRVLHSAGVPLDQLGRTTDGAPSTVASETIWRHLAEHWHRFLGTPVRYWMEHQLGELFDITEPLTPANADAVHDRIATTLADVGFRPRALFERFGLEVLATTDDPADDLAAHRALAEDPDFTGRVLPTWRADRFMTPDQASWPAALDALAERTGIDCSSYASMVRALRASRQYFIDHGCTATDTGVADAGSAPLDEAEAERIHGRGLRGEASSAEAAAYRHNLLYRFAEWSCEDGLVMQLHPGVIRNHHRPTFDRFGADAGADLPDVASFTRPLTPLLQDFGTNPNLHLVLFTVDETAFSREIAPLAGFYPAVYVGAPWWFIDTPAAIRRFRAAAVDSAGWFKTSGFIDDTRAFCSIPARHDMSRRCDAADLAERVTTHQLSEDDAVRVARALVDEVPRTTFKL